MELATLPSRLSNSLLANGESQSSFARSAGVQPESISMFIRTYRGFKRGSNVQKIKAEMERRGWLNDQIERSVGFRTKPVVSLDLTKDDERFLTHLIMSSNLSKDRCDDLLTKLGL